MLDPDCLLLKQMLIGTEAPNISSDLLLSLTLSLHSGREIVRNLKAPGSLLLNSMFFFV